MFAKTDVADEAQAQAAVDAAGKLGPLRVLVNCAGLGNAARTVDRHGTPFDLKAVITSYSIHYTKLYELVAFT